MKLQKNKEYFGFKLIEKRKLKDINVESYFFKHQKSGAELLWLKNDDRDKLFSIAFKTPTFNSTGINHILEHAVLQGSEKYPVKSIFSFLVKSTSATFINAMTYPDKTVYPVASLYETELRKLRNVYCDAVFNPNVLRDESIFQQEKKVVFNEMKGVMSNIDRIIEEEITSALFPDNFYKYNSGGEPAEILKLTHQNLVEHHQKFYTPENSYTFIYGKTNILNHLKFLDQNYFNIENKGNPCRVKSDIKLQKRISKPIMKTKKFFSLEKKGKKGNVFNLSFLLASQKERRDIIGLGILFSLLLGDSSAPLKKALLDSKIADKIETNFWTEETIQTVFSLTLKNTNLKDKNKFKKIFFETLEQIVKNGFDQKLIQSKINKIEFALAESKIGTEKGIAYLEASTLTWLNNFGVTLALESEKEFQNIKKLVKKRYFEKLIQKYFLKNKHYAFLIFKPTSQQKEINFVDQVNEELEKENEEISFKPLSLKKLPINEQLGQLKIIKKNKTPYLWYPIKNKKIRAQNFYFDTRNIPIEKIPYLQLLAQILNEMTPQNKTLAEWKQEINQIMGGLSFSLQLFNNQQNDILPKFIVHTKFLVKQQKKVNQILEQVFEKLIFDEKIIKDKIKAIKNSLEDGFVSNGHVYAMSLAGKKLNFINFLEEQINGYDYYQFLQVTNIEEIIKNLEEIYQQLFQKKNLIVSLVSKEKVEFLLPPEKKVKIIKIKNILGQKKLEKTALVTNSQVQYNAILNNYDKFGLKFHGSWQAFKVILQYRFLWQEIREKGGAYGAFLVLTRKDIGLASYRDPRLKATFLDYQKIIKLAGKTEIFQEEIEDSIIKAISELDLPRTDFRKANLLVDRFIGGISPEKIQKERKQLLTANSKDWQKFIEVLETLKKGNLATVGSQQAIQKNKNFFKEII